MTTKRLSPAAAAALRRTVALVCKETWQVVRDPSSIIVGIFLPIMLLLLFGYGVNFDVKNLPVAVVMEDRSQEAREIVSGFELSDYFKTSQVATMAEAERLLARRDVSAILRIPVNFARDAAQGAAEVQFAANGTDANTARIALSYAQGALGAVLARRQAAEGNSGPSGPAVSVQNRLWFNEANDSTHFLVPGLIVIIMTLIGALLTALVVAREWERGTFEALFVTPARSVEILLGKTIPYFVLGMMGLALSVAGSRLLFGVPLRGSLWILVLVSMLYLVVALAIGLVISSLTRSQFLASQATILVTFLPAMLLSGFIFDISSMPWPVQIITRIFPARYFVKILQSLFLAGDIWPLILPNAAVLAFMATVLMSIAFMAMRKKLG